MNDQFIKPCFQEIYGSVQNAKFCYTKEKGSENHE